MENEEYGGFWIRVLASIIDSAVLYLPMHGINTLVFLSVMGMTPGEHQLAALEMNSHKASYLYAEPDAVLLWTTPLGILFGILYFGGLTASKWQGTVGKKVLGLKVVGEDGNRVGFGRSIGRYLGYFPSAFLCYIGFILVGTTERKQGLHDMMASTYVVFKK